VVASGTPTELMGSGPGEEIRFGGPPGIDVADLGRTLGADVTEVSPGEYLATTAPTPAAVAALTCLLATHDLPLADLRAGRQRLEDVFLRLTTEASAAAVPVSGAATDPVEPAGSGRSRRRRR
jgi:ABC-2 type transport system ATP-binding protein